MEQIVTVIVPVYNGEEHLHRCIDSILGQSCAYIQVILINDGSTDSSGEICDSFAQKDTRVTVIHQRNRGVSAARNAGLDAAAGNWILFVDADDHILPDYCANMLDAALNSDADVVIARPFVEGDSLLYRFDSEETDLLKRTCLAYDETQFAYNVDAPWGKLFRRDLIEEHRIRFPENLSRSEDALFCATLYECARQIVCLNGFGYVHEERPGSLCRRFSPEAPEMLENILSENQKWIRKFHPDARAYETALWHRVMPGIDECEQSFFLHPDNMVSIGQKSREYHAFLRRGMVAQGIRWLKVKNVKKRQYRIRLILYKLGLGGVFLMIKSLKQGAKQKETF